MQIFSLDCSVTGRTVKLLFSQPTDTYGRIIVYNLDILGSCSPQWGGACPTNVVGDFCSSLVDPGWSVNWILFKNCNQLLPAKQTSKTYSLEMMCGFFELTSNNVSNPSHLVCSYLQNFVNCPFTAYSKNFNIISIAHLQLTANNFNIICEVYYTMLLLLFPLDDTDH